MADDTIEVREVIPPNSGKDPFPVTFKRQKLPKKFALNQPGQTYAEEFLTPDQLEIGQTLNVFGRFYLLEGCDNFTRYFYATKYNRNYENLYANNQNQTRNPRDSNSIVI